MLLDIRIVDDVLSCVRGRKRDRDNKIRCDEAQKSKNKKLALPSRQQRFEHRDRTLPVRAFRGDAAVDRICSEKRQQHQNECRDRRERASSDEGDAGLITERRKIIDAGQAHHLPPRMFVMADRLRRVHGLRGFRPLHQPVPKSGTGEWCR